MADTVHAKAVTTADAFANNRAHAGQLIDANAGAFPDAYRTVDKTLAPVDVTATANLGALSGISHPDGTVVAAAVRDGVTCIVWRDSNGRDWLDTAHS